MKELRDKYISFSFDDDDHSPVKVEQFILNYSRFFPTDRDAMILDIGPGRGEMLIALARQGFRNVRAIDISPEVIERCRSLAQEAILVRDAADFLAESNEAYSLITVLDVLEHLDKRNVVRFLAELRRIVAAEGRIILQVPNMGGIFPSLHRYNDFTHEVCFNDHSLRQVLLAAGFRRIEFFPFENLVGSSWKHRLGKALRDRLLYPAVRLVRIVDGSLDTKFLTPVIFAVVRP